MSVPSDYLLDTLSQLAFDYDIVAEQIRTSNRRRKRTMPDVLLLSTAITNIRLEDKMEGSSTLEIEILDADFTLIDFFDVDSNGHINPVEINYPALSANWWRLTQMDIEDAAGLIQITLTFMERPAVYLMHHYGPVKSSRGATTRAEFFKLLVEKVTADKLVFKSRELHVRQPVKGRGTPATHGKGTLWIGDSLSVGTLAKISKYADRGDIEDYAKQSRTAAEGLAILNDKFGSKYVSVVFDLGTNDDPSNPSAYRTKLNAVKAKVGSTPLVVATINRGSGSVVGMNVEIEDFVNDNSDVTLVDWGAEDSWIGPDGTHPTSAGYDHRADMFSKAL